MNWRAGPLKRWLDLNDSGVWGNDPDGVDDVEVLRSTDIAVDGSWSIKDPAVRAINAVERAAKTLETGDLVVVKSSGSEAHLGKTAIVTQDVALRRACFANFVQRLRPSPSADGRYVWYLLNSKHTSDEMAVMGNTSTGLRNLNGTLIGQVTFPGPPVVEQRAIADFLDTETARIDALVAKKQLLARRLAERRTALVDQLFEQQPESPRLSRILEQSPCYGVLKPDRYDGQGAVPCIRISEIGTNGDLDLTGTITISPTQHAEYSRTRLRSGDVLVSCVGTIGRAAVVSEEAVGANVSRAVARLVPRTGLDPRYLSLWTESTGFRRAVDLMINATAQPVLNMGDLASMKVPMPAKAEETRRLWAGTRAELAPIREAIAALAGQLALLTERRQALIMAAVSGELEVPEVAA